MTTINQQTKNRLVEGVQKFQPILRKACLSNKNESDTVTIVADILCEVFGYDKYENITSELVIKRTFCDLAIKLDEQIRLLIECKAVSVHLREEHVFQATNYAANAGVDWVVLTNGINWKIYRMIFEKPVKHVMVYDFDFCKLDAEKSQDIALLYSLCLEEFTETGNASLERMFSQRVTVDQYIIGQVMLNDWMVKTIRGSVLRHFPSVNLTDDEIKHIMQNQIFRQEIVSGSMAEEAAQVVAAANSRMKAERKGKKQF